MHAVWWGRDQIGGIMAAQSIQGEQEGHIKMDNHSDLMIIFLLTRKLWLSQPITHSADSNCFKVLNCQFTI